MWKKLSIFLKPKAEKLSFHALANMKHIFNEVHYELTRKIAEGGMGMVYEATQKGIGGFRKVVAIKLIREEYSAIEEFRNNYKKVLLSEDEYYNLFSNYLTIGIN